MAWFLTNFKWLLMIDRSVHILVNKQSQYIAVSETNKSN